MCFSNYPSKSCSSDILISNFKSLGTLLVLLSGQFGSRLTDSVTKGNYYLTIDTFVLCHTTTYYVYQRMFPTEVVTYRKSHLFKLVFLLTCLPSYLDYLALKMYFTIREMRSFSFLDAKLGRFLAASCTMG